MTQEITLKGVVVCRGIALGPAFLLNTTKEGTRRSAAPIKDVEAEIARFKRACHASIQELEILKKQLSKEHLEEAVLIFDTHLQILQDVVFTFKVEDEIRNRQTSGVEFLQELLYQQKENFLGLNNAFFEERFFDIQDVVSRVISHLKRKVRVPLSRLPKGTIVLADHLTPSEVVTIKSGLLAGLVTMRGSPMSHVAIIAKSKQIPYITQVDFHHLDLKAGTSIVLDALKGELIVGPSEKTVAFYQGFKKTLSTDQEKLKKLAALANRTLDGEPVRLLLSVDSIEDLDHHAISYCDGIGLLRTECLFMAQAHIPTEDEQIAVYSKILEKMPDKSVVIRIFDWGGDKHPQHFEEFAESNPALGRRAIRLLLQYPHILRTQLRAILKASGKGKVKILIPMVTNVNEIKQVKKHLVEIQGELSQQGITVAIPPLGCMIEVPAAALQADLLATFSDFFSIGINDLVQYTLAADRGNDLVAEEYSPTHVSVLRLLHFVVRQAYRHKVPLSICGEVASHPELLSLILGCGLRSISIAPHDWPFIKEKLSTLSLVDSRLQLGGAMQASIRQVKEKGAPVPASAI